MADDRTHIERRWSVDPAAVLSAIPDAKDAKPLAGLPDAWHWSTAPRFDMTAALSQDRTHLFQCFALDCYDEGLAIAVLSFARGHGADLIAPQDRPLVAVEGFSHPGRAFDIVVAIGPAVHKYHADDPQLHAASRAVFPAHRCEFAGDEDSDDAWYRYAVADGVKPTRWNRELRPYLKMRHRTESGRVIPKRGFVQPVDLVHELGTLEGRPDRFVEFENHRHDVWRVEWDGEWVLTGQSSAARRLQLDELLDFVRTSLYGPNLNAVTSPR